jgi:hypothetical protein
VDSEDWEVEDGEDALLLAAAHVSASTTWDDDGFWLVVLARLFDREGFYVDLIVDPRHARELGLALFAYGNSLPDWPIEDAEIEPS